MDKKADFLLRKPWDASAFSLGPAVASTRVARNLDVRVQHLDDLLSSIEEIRDSLPLFAKSVAFLADLAADSVKSVARTSALINSARRAI